MTKRKNGIRIIGIMILSIIWSISMTPAHALETCEIYDPINDILTVKCDTNFTQLATEINDSSKISYLNNGEWLLNTTISTTAYTTFSIDSNAIDISWIKITGNHAIIIRGRGEIDGVKITSWDPIANTTVNQNKNKSIPRAYMSFELSTGGWINNSDIGYLGYRNRNNSKTAGISLYKSHDITISNSKFHDIYYAFYSANSYNITIDNNEYYHNLLYAIDPHTNSHDFKITNNHVHDNYKFGIIFSYRCYNFLVENNTIHDNNEGKTISYGIFLSRIASNSIVRNNTIYNESVGIDISQSQNNFIYANNISNTDRGIFILSGNEDISTSNSIYDNEIKSSKISIDIRNSRGNIITNNTNSIIGTVLVHFYNDEIYSIFDIINRIISSDKVETNDSEDNITMVNNSIESETNDSEDNTISDNNSIDSETRKNSTVIITFDDGSETIYDNAYPILKANNQKAVNYIIINRPDKARGYMNWSVLHKLYNEGWDISSHSVNHVDISKLDDRRLNYELNTSLNTLISMGFIRSAKFIAYPFGGIDNRTINFTKENGYIMGRISGIRKISQRINLSENNDVLYKIEPFEVLNDTSVAEIENAINDTIKQNRTLILEYHRITNENTTVNLYGSSQSNFKIISDYIASRKADISVITMSEYYDSLNAKK